MQRKGRSINSLASIFAKQLQENAFSGGAVEEEHTVDNIIREIELEHQTNVFKDVDFSKVIVGDGGNENVEDVKVDIMSGGADLSEMQENIFAGGSNEGVITDVSHPNEDDYLESDIKFAREEDNLTGGALPIITKANGEEIISNILMDDKKDDSSNVITDILVDEQEKADGAKIIEDILMDDKRDESSLNATMTITNEKVLEEEDENEDVKMIDVETVNINITDEQTSNVITPVEIKEDLSESESEDDKPFDIEDAISERFNNVDVNETNETNEDEITFDAVDDDSSDDEVMEEVVVEKDSLVDILNSIRKAHERSLQGKTTHDNTTFKREPIIRGSGGNGFKGGSKLDGSKLGNKTVANKMRYCKVIDMYPWIDYDDSDE